MASPPPGDSRRFSLFGFGDLWGKNEDSNSDDRSRRKGGRKVATPIVKLQTDKEVYRPGDSIFITIELQNPSRNENHDSSAGVASVDGSNSDASGLLVERISFELKGIEKLDSQWFTTQKPVPGSKQRRGEYAFLDCSASSMIVSQIVSSGTTKTYMVQTILPNVLPPSYKGATVRYLYYVRVALYGEWLILENGPPVKDLARDRTTVESRLPLQIWVSQIGNGLLGEEVQSDGIVPSQTMQPDLYWKEMEGDSDWIRANDAYDGIEDDGDSSRDEISSVSSYNPARESIHKAFRSSLSLQSSSSRFPSREAFHAEADEVLHNSTGDVLSPSKRLAAFQANKEINQLKSFSGATDDVEVTTPLRAMEAIPSEGFVRGRSYNIRVDDQVLLRFSPKKADPNYYFSDMIGGTLTFFHEDGTRRCLEVSVTLEISETINRRFVHPSRRNSPTITKVHSDYHEVVADLVQTSFLFSVPMDGPMSFSTPRVSVQWALRFEFLTTPRNVDWRSYDHPLLVEGRDKCEWVLPITVHASQPVASVASAQNRRAPSFEPFWIHD